LYRLLNTFSLPLKFLTQEIPKESQKHSGLMKNSEKFCLLINKRAGFERVKNMKNRMHPSCHLQSRF